MKWFWKTLTGYTVTFVSLDRVYTLVHRPFRKPLVTSESNPGGLHGKRYSVIFYEESAFMPPAKKEKNTPNLINKGESI